MLQPQNQKKTLASAVFVQFLQSYKTPVTHLFSAVYRGETTPAITIIGAHLVVGGFPPSHSKQMLSLIGSFPQGLRVKIQNLWEKNTHTPVN